MKKFTLTFASTLLLTTLALATENACSDSELLWTQKKQFTHLGSTDLSSVFIDTKNIKIDKKNKIIEVWVIFVQSKVFVSQAIKEYGNKYATYGYMKALNRFNYSQNTVNSKDFTNYNCNGSIIPEGITRKSDWREIRPASMDEAVMNSVITLYKLK